MTNRQDNPMQLNGFSFVEFSAPEEGILEPVFSLLGFEKVANHRSKHAYLWRQNDVDFVINYEDGSLARYLTAEHGPCATGLAFRVRDSQLAYNRALELGAQPMDIVAGPMELKLPAIKGIGNAPLYLIDRYEDGSSIFDIDFVFIENENKRPEGTGLKVIDHLTHNVYKGRVEYWADYYERLFNFREIRHFDIQGQQTGLLSKAMTAPDNKIRIPLNEESGNQHNGQIQDYLSRYNGEGIQHIAFACDNLFETIDRLKQNGVSFMKPPPDTYYDMLEERLPNHGEEVEALKSRGILLDGTTENGDNRLLLQIFSKTMVGPIFFEFIQRKRDEGFGEGNFQALFESIERDQLNNDHKEAAA